VIEGAALDLRVRDGVLDLGPLAALRTNAAGEHGASSGALPFHRVELRRSAVIVDWQGVRLQVPVECVIANQGGGEVGVDVRAHVLDTTVRIHGGLTPVSPDYGATAAWRANLAADALQWSGGGTSVTLKSATVTGTIRGGGPNGAGAELELELT